MIQAQCRYRWLVSSWPVSHPGIEGAALYLHHRRCPISPNCCSIVGRFIARFVAKPFLLLKITVVAAAVAKHNQSQGLVTNQNIKRLVQRKLLRVEIRQDGDIRDLLDLLLPDLLVGMSINEQYNFQQYRGCW